MGLLKLEWSESNAEIFMVWFPKLFSLNTFTWTELFPSKELESANPTFFSVISSFTVLNFAPGPKNIPGNRMWFKMKLHQRLVNNWFDTTNYWRTIKSTWQKFMGLLKLEGDENNAVTFIVRSNKLFGQNTFTWIELFHSKELNQ